MRNVKCIWFVVVLLATTSVVAFASGQSQKSAASSSGEMTISWLGGSQRAFQLQPNSYVQQYLEKKFNVKLKPWFGVDRYQTDQVMTKIGAGDIPDIFTPPTSLGTLADMGAIRQVPKDMIMQYMPNVMKKQLALAPNTLWTKTSYNGQNWGIPTAISIAKASPLIFVRKDWMQKVGVTKKPDTLAELQDLYLKFRNDDPNGNGKKDEYALAYPHSGNTGLTIERFFPNEFGAFGVGISSWYVENGKVVRDMILPKYEDALKFLHKWYELGIIVPSFSVDMEKDTEEQMAAGQIGAYESYSAWGPRPATGPYHAMAQNNPKLQLEYIISPAGPNGKRGDYARDAAWSEIAIGKDVSDQKLEKILQILNVLFTDPDTYSTMYLGRKGIDWKLDQNGNVQFLDDARTTPEMEKLGTTYFWFPIILSPVDKYYMPAWRYAPNQYALDHQVQLPIPYSAPLSSDDSRIMSQISKFEMEFAYQAIAGTVDIDKAWDGYVSQWKKLGGQQVMDDLNKIYASQSQGK